MFQATKSFKITRIKCRLDYDGEEFTLFENEILRLECLSTKPIKSKNKGLNVYECTSNGKFTLLNTTCQNENESRFDQLQHDVKKKKIFKIF